MDNIRAYRRSRLAAMKAKARRLYPHNPKARLANHLAVCSGYCCGNARRWGGISLAERRAQDREKASRYDALHDQD